MFKEILQIKPKMSPSDLNSMERSLSSRFGKVAKGFGRGLTSVLKGGGVAGAALGLIDKFLNPLKETQDAIDRTIADGDTAVTNAKQFGTTPGELLRLQALAGSTGLDASSLDVLINKFQNAVAEAANDPTKDSSVKAFVGQTDSAAAFFEFIQSLQKLSKEQQLLVQTSVFGEKQILKMADFLQSDFPELLKQIGGPSADQLTSGANKLAGLNDLKDRLAETRRLFDINKKASLITKDMVVSQDEQAKRDLAKENINIQGYKDLALISSTVSEIGNLVRTLTTSITSAVVRFYDIAKVMDKIGSSSALRGIMKFIKAE